MAVGVEFLEDGENSETINIFCEISAFVSSKLPNQRLRYVIECVQQQSPTVLKERDQHNTYGEERDQRKCRGF